MRMKTSTTLKDKQDLNPLLAKEYLPAFEDIQARHVVPAVRQILKEAEQELSQLEKNTTGWELIEGLNQIEYELHSVWGPAMHLMGVRNSPELREAQESVQKEFVSFCLRMEQSEAVYNALLTMQKEMEAAKEKYPPEKQRIITLRLRAAFHAGVGLKGKKRERFNAIATELSQLNTNFSNNVMDATKDFSLDLSHQEDIEGLPLSSLALAAQNYQQAHLKQTEDKSIDPPLENVSEYSLENSIEDSMELKAKKGPWRINLDAPSYIPFMQHARKRELRAKLYRAFISRASQGKYNNTAIITRILKIRQEQAQLLGFSSYAQMRMDTRMAENVAEVYNLIEELRKAAWEAAQQELTELQNFADKQGQKEELSHWDIAYFSERLREKNFGFTEEELRPYFPLEHVLQGLFHLAKQIFGITIICADKTPDSNEKLSVWHPDVRYFIVLDEEQKRIASFYLDPYSRPSEKRGGAWMDDCVGRRRVKHGRLDLPVAYLVCNAAPPLGKEPALMNFREVETLFHEFGHGLQHMLTKVDYPDVAGINGIEWDAVELPSQFMENWCYHRPALLSLSCHIESGKALPEELFTKIKAARNFRSASQLLRQLRFALIDMELHHNFDPSSPEDALLALQKKVDKQMAPMPSLAEDRFLCSFAHIFAGGYAAGYYSYKWAEVLSADAFSAFEEAGLDNPEAVQAMGRRFRDTILALGGSLAPALVFQSFRGRKASTEALLRHNGLAA